MYDDLKYFSMFSGIGGFELGIDRAMPGATCVGYSEIDKHAIKTFEEHFNHVNYGDATTIDPNSLPDFELLVGGFPCQTFSVAGRRRGFEEARGTLFFDIARIAKNKRPKHLLLENVKGLLNHRGGQTFHTMLGILADLGYSVEWCVLNSADFGVPQNRERVYIVGHLAACGRRQVFPIGKDFSEAIESSDDASSRAEAFIKTRHLSQNGSLVSKAITLQASEIPHIIQTPRGNNKGGKHEVAPTLTGSSYQHNNHVIGTINRGTFKETNGKSLTITASYHKGHDNHGGRPVIAHTLRSFTGGISERSTLLLDEETRIRRLTPTECERLQGFPDGWTLGSDTQRYKQCGNAVTVNVVAAVAARLKEHLYG